MVVASHMGGGSGCLWWERMRAEERRPRRNILIGLTQILVVGPRLGPLGRGEITSSAHPQSFLGPLVEMAR